MLDLVQPLSAPHIDSDRRFDLSPDGEKIAFSWNKSGSWEIHKQCVEQIGNLLYTSMGSKFSPQYSPGRNSSVFALDLDERESSHILLYDFKKSKSKGLTAWSGYAQRPVSYFHLTDHD